MNSAFTALVTGASGGIGQHVVRRLRSAGGRVAVVGRDAPALDAELHIGADTTTADGAASAVAAASAGFGGPPQRLVHCVGSTLIAPLHRTSAEQYREVMRVNLDSAFYSLAAWVDALRSAPAEWRSGASAVLMSSVVARIGVANHEAIAAAKGGVEALARAAAASYAALGLRVNAVAPGLTETPMTAGMLVNDQLRQGAARQYPLVGIQHADDVAATVCWLLSGESSRITGQVIAVDGGFAQIRPLVK